MQQPPHTPCCIHCQCQFLPADFTVTQWEDIQPYYDQLLERVLSSPDALRQWFIDRSMLEEALAEDMGWRYIRMTCDTTNDTYRERYDYYVKEILPKIAPINHMLNQKAVACPHAQVLQREEGFDILLRCIERSLQVYRPENIPIQTRTQLKAHEYSALASAMTVVIDGQEVTLQQAGVHLESLDRDLRQAVYTQINDRRLQDKGTLDDIYTSLIQDRHQMAINAGFSNFRDYAFAAMQRFDYTPEDCFAFHKAVEREVVPILSVLSQERQLAMKIPVIKPWDVQVDPMGRPPLKPFDHAEELLQKTITVFDRLDPFLGDCLRTMQSMGHFDLASRKGKAPGGYNYPLDKTGVPFIFMNATSTLRDMCTMLHEGGHAVHAFLTQGLLLHDFKQLPSEIAELASMSMELLTMEHWDVFFPDQGDLRRAKKQHLAQIVHTLAWVATIDKFQHWVYENPKHSLEQRRDAWTEILELFGDPMISWEGQQEYQFSSWQKQLHLFEVPFYYIEYGIAQLGAIAVWKNYQENPQQGLQCYLDALKLGYTRPVPQVYEAAGVQFNFQQPYIKELMAFIEKQIV